jgi:hypothetical protein
MQEKPRCKNKLCTVGWIALALLAPPVASFAQSVWASPCSAGITIEEVSLDNYRLLGSSLLHRAGTTGVVRGRINVTNTSIPNTSTPPWTTLELGYTDKGAGSVTAELVVADPCTGAIASICVVESVDSPRAGCVMATFPSNTFDFANEIYYIQVKVVRSSVSDEVRANSVRIY